MLKKPSYQQVNLTSQKRNKPKYLSENCNLTIKGADKNGKIVIMNTADYIEHFESRLNDRESFEKLDANPILIYTDEVKKNLMIC